MSTTKVSYIRVYICFCPNSTLLLWSLIATSVGPVHLARFGRILAEFPGSQVKVLGVGHTLSYSFSHLLGLDSVPLFLTPQALVVRL